MNSDNKEKIIKTNHAIGDEVYYIFNGKINHGTITKIIITITDKEQIEKIHIQNDEYDIIHFVDSNVVFYNKEDARTFVKTN